MGEFTICNDYDTDSTLIPNLFIDEYMTDANDAQIKIYLYLVRMMSAGKVTSIAEMADHFNHTEKEVIRSLKYWEKKGLIALELGDDGRLVSIHLCEVRPQSSAYMDEDRVISITPVSSTPIRSARRTQRRTAAVSARRAALSASAAEEDLSASAADIAPEAADHDAADSVDRRREAASAADAPAVPSGSTAASGRTQATLSRSGSGRQSADREAVNDPAAVDSSRTELFFVVEQYIGKPLSATEMMKVNYIADDLHFSDDLIDYLVQYCVGMGKKDFRYIEKVAVNWANEGISTTKQAQENVARGPVSSRSKRNGRSSSANSFNKFKQNQYDFDELEKKLLNN